MLKSITEDDSRALTQVANDNGITREQIVSIVANQNGTVTLYYYE
jgi:DNA-binding phage protein